MQYLVKSPRLPVYSVEVILELLRSKCKCIPNLIYGLECFSLPKSDFEIVGLCCHSISNEIFQDIQ